MTSASVSSYEMFSNSHEFFHRRKFRRGTGGILNACMSSGVWSSSRWLADCHWCREVLPSSSLCVVCEQHLSSTAQLQYIALHQPAHWSIPNIGSLE